MCRICGGVRVLEFTYRVPRPTCFIVMRGTMELTCIYASHFTIYKYVYVYNRCTRRPKK